jgi:hypothetical protein
MLACVYNEQVMSTREPKNTRINVNTSASLRVKFRAVSILDDSTMSDLINRFMRMKVNEAETKDPEKFKEALEQAKEQEELERQQRRPNKNAPPDNYEDLPQNHLFSDGTGKPVTGKRRSPAIERDIEDATKDAIERTRKKKASQKTK